MTFYRNILCNEDGSILAGFILILSLLIMIGFASVDLSNTEVTTSGNEVAYKQNIFNAEAAVVENTHRLSQATNDEINDTTSYQWLNSPGDLPQPDDIQNLENWTDAFSKESVTPDTRFLTCSEGIATGSSLDMSHTQIRTFTIYGQCRRESGLSTVRIGFRRAF